MTSTFDTFAHQIEDVASDAAALEVLRRRLRGGDVPDLPDDEIEFLDERIGGYLAAMDRAAEPEGGWTLETIPVDLDDDGESE